jgi:hypothetical protein
MEILIHNHNAVWETLDLVWGEMFTEPGVMTPLNN